MALIAQGGNARSGIAGHLYGGFAALKDILARRRAYGRTLRELSALSSEELADLGLTRASIEQVAREAVYGPVR